MTTENNFEQMTVQAGQDLTADSVLFKGLSLNGTILAAAGHLAAGVLRSKVSSGGHASVVYQGITKVDVGAAVSTIGFPLKLTTSGWFTVAASGDGVVVGRALATASSGDRVKAYVDFTKLGFFGG